jgi:hypothetical protein
VGVSKRADRMSGQRISILFPNGISQSLKEPIEIYYIDYVCKGYSSGHLFYTLNEPDGAINSISTNSSIPNAPVLSSNTCKPSYY